MSKLEDLKKHLDKTKTPRKEEFGFQVPDGYFDSLHDRVISQIEETKQPNRQISWFKITSMAASICLILSVALWLTNDSSGTVATPLAMSELTSEETIDYLLDTEVEGMTTDDMLELENIDEILADLEDEIID